MKVVYINYLFDKQESSVGAAVHVKEFVRTARQFGVDVVARDVNKFESVEAATQNRLRGWLKKHLSRYLNQPNALLSNIGYFRKEWRIVSEEKPDALLVRYNLFNISAPLVAFLKGVPLVLEVNAPMAFENRTYNKNVVHLPFLPEWTERFNLKMAKRVFTVSNALKSFFVNQDVSGDKITVVPNGVDVERFTPQTSGRTIREKYGFGEGVVFGFVGSFHYWHGLESIEKFVQTLSEKHENARFLLVGSGPLKEDIQRAIEQEGLTDRVVLPGFVPHEEIPAYVAAMDVALAPYPPTDFFYFSPLKLFEYMAAGKTVVASRIGQIAEIVEDGENGVLYEPGDIDALIQKCSALIENPKHRKSIGEKARELMVEKYTWRHNVERILGLLNEACGRKVTGATDERVVSPEFSSGSLPS